MPPEAEPRRMDGEPEGLYVPVLRTSSLGGVTPGVLTSPRFHLVATPRARPGCRLTRMIREPAELNADETGRVEPRLGTLIGAGIILGIKLLVFSDEDGRIVLRQAQDAINDLLTQGTPVTAAVATDGGSAEITPSSGPTQREQGGTLAAVPPRRPPSPAWPGPR